MSITIAIPFYNAEEYLADAIRSVFAQTYQDWELILMDDGSTDNSLAIAKSVQDPRVRVVSDGKNKKLAARLNEVTKLAKYEYIARMDADDLMVPERLEKQMSVLTNHKYDLVTSGVFSVLNNLELVGVRGKDFDNVTLEALLSRKIGITHAAVVARKSWYERNKYDEKLAIAQDIDLWFRSAQKDDIKILSLSEPLYVYREEANVTRFKLLRAYSNERNMIRSYSKSSSIIQILKLYLKSGVVIGLDQFGLIPLLQKRRSTEEITDQQLNYFNSAIKIIKSTVVPGLN